MRFPRVSALHRTVVPAAALLLFAGPGAAQDAAPSAPPDATIAVEGVVRGVFRREGGGRDERIVPIEIRRTEILRRLPSDARVAAPAPGDVLYVHVLGRAGGPWQRAVEPTTPRDGATVRAFADPAGDGTWRAAPDPWFQTLDGGAAPPARLPGAGAPAPGPAPAPSSLGIATDLVSVHGRRGLKVTSVTPGGAGQKAGLEIGDVIVAAAGQPIEGADSLEAAARAGRPFTIGVVDVNTGRVVDVEVAPAAEVRPVDPVPPAGEPNVPRGSGGRLGIVGDVGFYDVEAAVKVTAVEPGSPAARAGIRPGMLIVQANGKPVLHPKALEEAVAASGRSIRLSVVESPPSGRPVPIDVALP
jgi:membrane-associated protease RseP (regulator of RpoE activity)